MIRLDIVESLLILGSIALALMLGAMSPGPTFIYVAKNSIAISRKHGLFTALGTGTGAAFFGFLAVMGLQAVLLAVPSAYLVLKICGGLYLLYLGWQMLKSALKTKNNTDSEIQSDVSPIPAKSHLSLLFQGFFTNMANPKALVYFSSVFALAIQSNAPLSAQTSLLGLIWLESLLRFALVAVFFSWHKMTQYYQQFAKWIDGISGGIFTLLGVYLIGSR